MVLYTLNSRENFLLSVIEKTSNLSSIQLNQLITDSLVDLKEILISKGFKYEDFKNILIPRPNRKEIGLIFDSRKITSGRYGIEIMESLLPHLRKLNQVAICAGDYIYNGNQSISDSFMDNLVTHSSIPIDYSDLNYFYIIYVNNLTENMFNELDQYSSENISSYIGFIDFTFSSLIKSWCATILVHDFILLKNCAISSCSDECLPEDVNEYGYDFSKFGLCSKTIPEELYSLFLEYKIETNSNLEMNDDIRHSFTFLSESFGNINDYEIIVSEEKLRYIFSEKKETLKLFFDETISRDELAKQIKEKLLSNYFFELTIDNQHNTIKCVTLLELHNNDVKYKYTVVFKILLNEKQLFIVTMY